ncbi:alpha/beta hydrolase family protein [Alkanindiges illinoisensis]|uniref:Alpha/beta fold hydrolase n=1 Tax=Alkanindiges illinoisensis TaxID=197183 RepID=A0A4Y7XBE1_9GAMM|nr:alpha/beta fold hydrolase [Alkanindiges illinoisensis]TEU25592.1 alpha/beta fold hydrolase [Alkanindiges illinoisensis]
MNKPSTPQAVQIIAEDGYALSGHFFKTEDAQQKRPVLLCPATGIVQQFYFRFCEWLSQQGHAVLVFDFRGIGQSLHEPVKYSNARIQDWGQLDIPAALDWLTLHTGQQQVILIGHSAGGQLTGLVRNHQKIAQVIAIAGSTGHVKGLSGKTKWLAPVLFNVYMPLNIRLYGHANNKKIGWGENLPKGVARQWAEWCSKPGYVANALGKSVDQHYHAEIRCPVTAIHASDDEIATRANVADLLRLYPNAAQRTICLEPATEGFGHIGHMDLFRSSHQRLWPVVLDAIIHSRSESQPHADSL